jgi:hypothetical protein
MEGDSGQLDLAGFFSFSPPSSCPSLLPSCYSVSDLPQEEQPTREKDIKGYRCLASVSPNSLSFPMLFALKQFQMQG